MELSSMIQTVEMEKPDGEKKMQLEMVDAGGVMVQKKFEALYKKNHDFLGWLTIADTHVDYPVMYTPNDNENGEFYIHRDFDMEYSAAGLLFLDRNCDVRIPTDNLIVYGHNMNSGGFLSGT